MKITRHKINVLDILADKRFNGNPRALLLYINILKIHQAGWPCDYTNAEFAGMIGVNSESTVSKYLTFLEDNDFIKVIFKTVHKNVRRYVELVPQYKTEFDK